MAKENKVSALKPAEDTTQDKLKEVAFDTGAKTCVALEGANLVWSVGKDIVSAWVQLGMNEKASQAEVVVSDPTGEAFEKLANHSLKNGGITQLPGSTPSGNAPGAVGATNTTPLGSGTPANLEAPPGTLTAMGQKYAKYLNNPGVRAAFDAIARAELGEDKMHRYDLGFGFRSIPTYPNSHPYYGSELTPEGQSSASGRYQFMGMTWKEFDQKLGLGGRFDPTAQTIAAIALLDRRGALEYAAAGDWANVARRVQDEWTSIDSPERAASQAQGNGAYSVTSRVFATSYAKYSGGQTPKLEATPAQTGNNTTPPASNMAVAPPAVVKGNKLYVYHKGFTFTYYHQGTDYDIETGKLTIKGTGVRFSLAQRKRNKTEKSISLKQWAEKICTAHKVKLDWQALTDIDFEFIDQSGVSDLDRLKQECKKAGLFISDNSSIPVKPGEKPLPPTITIKSLQQVKDSGIIISRGTCLISGKMSDEPLDGNKTVPDLGSSLMQPEAKTTINPINSTVEKKLPDIDTKKDNSVTGAKTPTADAKPKPGQEAIQISQAARVKRVQGLPSKFVVISDDKFLALEPLSAVRTEGASFPGILSRVWMVDTIKHDLVNGTSELKVFSPIEVIDNTPPVSAVTPTGTGTPGQAPIGFTPQAGYVVPMSGVVTSPYGQRWGRLHAGVDIAEHGVCTIVAAADGVVQAATTYTGYGKTLDVKHANGLTRYAHLSSFSVSEGAQVKQGQPIGIVDQNWTGSGTGQHLHFEIRSALDFGKGTSIDPASVITSLQVGNEVKAGQK
jgi:murein DD-endopeptidase MepM/ murein hydrolase activator NlpD/muramidase (phage lysozyme)